MAEGTPERRGGELRQRAKLRAIELKGTLYRRRYLIPNAVTLGNMFCGFLAGIYAATGRFEKAALAIGVAILLDGLDGRVARRLNATSRFGLEIDSFADLVSFGVAPALLMYFWCFRLPADEFGVAVSFVYLLCAASRLARFNMSAENLKNFVGLPSPGAAGFVAALVNFQPLLVSSKYNVVFGSIVMVSLAFLMVSRIEFFSIKALRVRRIHPLTTIAIGGLIALLWYNNQVGFLLLISLYVLSGPVNYLRAKWKLGKSGPVDMPPVH